MRKTNMSQKHDICHLIYGWLLVAVLWRSQSGCETHPGCTPEIKVRLIQNYVECSMLMNMDHGIFIKCVAVTKIGRAHV